MFRYIEAAPLVNSDVDHGEVEIPPFLPRRPQQAAAARPRRRIRLLLGARSAHASLANMRACQRTARGGGRRCRDCGCSASRRKRRDGCSSAIPEGGADSASKPSAGAL